MSLINFVLTGNKHPLRLDLGGSNGKKKIDSRQHKRFQLNENAFALIRSIHTGPLKIYCKSMAFIACAVFNAKPAKLGKIDNLSMGKESIPPIMEIQYFRFFVEPINKWLYK